MVRPGGHLGDVLTPRPFSRLNLSPDEKRLAIGVGGTAGVSTDVWLLELARGVLSKLTFAPDSGSNPIWSPDGGRIAFRVGLANPRILQKASSGAGAAESLITAPDGGTPQDWSRDGRHIVFERNDPKSNRDLWVWNVQEKKSSAVLRTGFNESQGQLSPDGRWLAYISDESNPTQVYVQSFPPSGGKWQISSGGGSQPRWRRDGKELYYIAPDRKLMAVAVKTGAAFEALVPAALFQTQIASTLTTGHDYAVSADGKRFLIIGTLEKPEQPEPMTVLVNWMAGLK
jgi:Tol biopolymer transport system component